MAVEREITDREVVGHLDRIAGWERGVGADARRELGVLSARLKLRLGIPVTEDLSRETRTMLPPPPEDDGEDGDAGPEGGPEG